MACSRRHLVVTGAASGIGEATVTAAAAKGFHVFAGRREVPGDEPTRSSGRGLITHVQLDITDADQIAAAAATVADHVGNRGLQGLANVAGVGISGPLELVPIDTMRRQYEVNVFGQLAVTQAFLPQLRRAQGRILFMGTVGDRLTVPFAGPLTSSKYALAAICDTLRLELAPWGIEVVLIEPASISTPAVDKLEQDAHRTVAGFTAEGRALYGEAYQTTIKQAVAQEREGSPPSDVADKVLEALEVRRPHAHYLVGRGARVLATVATLPPMVQDTIKRRLFHLPGKGDADE